MASPAAAALDRMPGLHALRLFAALPIFLLHFTFFVSVQPSLPIGLVRYFSLGVQLFYVLSAFALMYSVRAYADQTGWIGRFYIKRFFRIAPLFYVMMVAGSLYRAFLGEPAPSGYEVTANVFFVFNIWPGFADGIPYAGWSIGVEMVFYLCFPLAVMFVRSIRAAIALVVAAVVASQVGHVYFADIPVPPFATYADFSFVTNAPCFAFGILAFLVYDRCRRSGWAKPSASAVLQDLFFAAAAISLIGLILAFETTLRSLHRLDTVLWALVFAVLSLWAALRPLPGLGWAPIQFLGERSYSLYLVHPVVLLLISPTAVQVSADLAPVLGVLATPIILAMSWLVVVAASTITYALIERPGMILGKRLLRTTSSPAVAPVEGQA